VYNSKFCVRKTWSRTARNTIHTAAQQPQNRPDMRFWRLINLVGSGPPGRGSGAGGISFLLLSTYMKTLEGRAAEELWDRYWREMRREWFKLEVLQDYSGEDASPSLAKWLEGDEQGSIALMKAENHREWAESCRQKLAEGVKLTRLHIVEKPYGPYLRWELRHYEHINVPRCGEKVYLVDKARTAALDIPEGDLMIFDDSRAVVNTYDKNGLMIRETFYEKGDDISRFLRLAAQLKELAQPLPARA